ncbi:hypothetical protein HYW21_03965 [Candidatus Woesearchaeota archaeon]|nr:hypothetical protein [Candidatus Woesearchaeota archaeon]
MVPSDAVDQKKAMSEEKVELVGFHDLEPAEFDLLTKRSITHTKKLVKHCNTLEQVVITKKNVHEREKSQIYELHFRILNRGKVSSVVVTERNLFLALDEGFKKVQHLLKA